MNGNKYRRSTVAGLAVLWTVILFLCGGFNLTYAQRVLFDETFEDTAYTSRGWYDYSNPFVTTTTQHAAGSVRSCEFHWTAQGQTTPAQKGARARIDPVEGLTLTFNIKFSQNWAWTGLGWHPHFIQFTTSVDGDIIGPAYTHLTLYVEPVDGKQSFALQDGMNINMAHLGENLVGLNENRSVAGGNGDSDGYGGAAYNNEGVYWNGKALFSDSLVFTENQGPYYKSDWHEVKTHIQLNSIIDGKGVANGVAQCWYDGKLIMDYHDLLMRTGQHPSMKLDHFLLLPYFAPSPPQVGVPHEQTIWIDNIKIIQDEQQLPPVDPPVYNATLIDEKFENTNYASRGWYDSPGMLLDNVTYTQGSGSSAKFEWADAGNTSPSGQGGRLLFDPVEGFTVSYYTRFSDNWEWSADTTLAQSLLWFVTNKDDQWTNPTNTFLTAQVSTSAGKLKLLLSDYKNIDTAHLGEDRTGVTEYRAVCGGNGDSDSHGGTYSSSSGAAQNRKTISTNGVYFTDNPGPDFKGDWHLVKVHMQLNSIVGGKGVANGVAQFWYDGKEIVNHQNVMFRTGQHADMKFNQLMLLPYFSGGVAHPQTVWVDDILLVKDERTLRIPVPQNPDVNADGKVNLLDVVAFILKGIKTPGAPELDLNNDGVYRVNDVLEMLHKVIKLK